MKTVLAASVALLLSSVPSLAAGTGVAYGRVTTVQMFAPLECAVEVQFGALSGDLTRIIYRGKLAKAVCVGSPTQPPIFPFDLVIAPFKLEPALCGPDLCSNIIGTEKPVAF